MFYVETDSKDAAFHFSAEEYFMGRFSEPVMMLWRTNPCVMLGRYQAASAEINMDYAEKAGVQIVRRSSGGGTIFTDLNTILYTMILPYTEEQCTRQIAKEAVAGPVIDALNQMGVPAKLEGRNDILADGKKISGMAQYVQNNRLCTHGSLLYDTDLEMLTRVLNVDKDKIRSKAISSVRSRVTNIKEYTDHCSTMEFYELLKKKLHESQVIQKYTLSANDLGEIENIYHQKYGNPAWVFGKSPKFSFHNSKRFEEGKVEIYLNVIKGVIESCSIRGDFLGTISIRGLEEHFKGAAFQYRVISNTLDGVTLRPYLGGITKDQLLACMFEG